MRIRSEKSFLFRGDNEEVTIRRGEIKDVSNWVAKTDTFKLAKAEGSILIIATKTDKKKAENEEYLEAETSTEDIKK
ncbi:hypothetical protein [Clostridium botulinum]|uniref:hypothetical protein n=1 Tax=Clostridium botulinum TaxID=1491 RepID=UPI000772EFB6|nr:hypothetical protein [Clostridium botulinum]